MLLQRLAANDVVNVLMGQEDVLGMEVLCLQKREQLLAVLCTRINHNAIVVNITDNDKAIGIDWRID